MSQSQSSVLCVYFEAQSRTPLTDRHHAHRLMMQRCRDDLSHEQLKEFIHRRAGQTKPATRFKNRPACCRECPAHSFPLFFISPMQNFNQCFGFFIKLAVRRPQGKLFAEHELRVVGERLQKFRNALYHIETLHTNGKFKPALAAPRIVMMRHKIIGGHKAHGLQLP